MKLSVITQENILSENINKGRQNKVPLPVTLPLTAIVAIGDERPSPLAPKLNFITLSPVEATRTGGVQTGPSS